MSKGTPKFLPVKVCERCDLEYQTTSSRQKFCSDCVDTGKVWYVWSLDYKKRLRRLCQMAKNRSKSKELEFNIDGDYLIKLWEENEGCCALTGQPFDLTNWGEHGQVNPNTPSVDRIIPKLGYVKGNVRLITYHMNIALSDFGVEQFEHLLRTYREFN